MGAMGPIQDFGQDESGATAIEYGLLAAIVASAGVFGLQEVGLSLSNFMTDTSSELRLR